LPKSAADGLLTIRFELDNTLVSEAT